MMKRVGTLLVVVLASIGRAETTGSVTPVVNFVSVAGDERKFREDWWMNDRWSGGIDEFTLEQDLGEHAVLRAEGRGVVDGEDYRLRLEIVRYDVGFVRAGYTQYRSYSDDWGGFYRPFTPPAFRLDRDLHLDHGDFFVDVGLTLPDRPKLRLGYERQFRDGTKSLLQWDSVEQGGTERKIFPSFKDIDERVDIFKVSLDHHVSIVNFGDQFRFERYQAVNNTFDQAFTNQSVHLHEEAKNDLLSNVFHMDSRVNNKTFWSAAYMYTRMDGAAGLKLDTIPFSPVSPTVDAVRDWFTHSVDLDQDSHVVTANAMFDPFKRFSLYAGAQAEKTRGTGNTDAELLEVLGTVTNAPLALVRSDTDKESLEETLGARFTGIPRTTVYAEGKWREDQYSLSEFETLDGSTNILHDADTDVLRQQYTVGFNTTPLRRVSFSAHYRRIVRQDRYDNTADTSPGYPGFITEQELTTDQIVARLSLRPHAKFTVALQYKLAASDIRTSHRAIFLSGTTLVPAGSVLAGNYDADTYTASATFTPVPALYLTGAFTFQDTRTIGFANNVPSVLAYRGNVYTAFGGLGYALDAKTDLTVDYVYSRADNFRDNSAAGLPLGLDNQRHALTAGVNRRIRANVLARLRYGFYEAAESSHGGLNNYRAQLASASCTIGF
jgi:hypothetical protein